MRKLIELARSAGRSGIAHELVPPRNGRSRGEAPALRSRWPILFRLYGFSYRRQFVLRRQGSPVERIPAPTINGAFGGLAWGAWVPQNWSQSTGNPAQEI
ncbi:MAG TPA: hypothetical protein VJ625_15760 [Propionibacteriaceae bacterium]|nr:hypothetical protein [Propionibacteriaceae bacterium]